MINILFLFLGLIIGTIMTIVILSMFDKKKDTYEPTVANERDEVDDYLTTSNYQSYVDERPVTAEDLYVYDIEEKVAKKEYAGEITSLPVLLSLSEERVASSGVILENSEEEKKATFEAENERNQFIETYNSEEVKVPALRYTLSREDVMDYLEDTKLTLLSQNKDVVPVIKPKKQDDQPDLIYANNLLFGLIYEFENIIKMYLRLGKIDAEKIKNTHTAVSKEQISKNDDWYSLVFDQSYINKDEIYQIVDKSYYYMKDKNQLEISSENDISMPKTTDVFDVTFKKSVDYFNLSLEKHRTRNKLEFTMTKARLLHHAEKYKTEKMKIIDRAKTNLPASIKENGKTFALVYQRKYPDTSEFKGKTYVSLIVRISDSYAKWLMKRHPGVRRAKFPKNRYWYIVPIDSSFHSAEMVYRVLRHAKTFVSK